jgi:hypothetical protein
MIRIRAGGGAAHILGAALFVAACDGGSLGPGEAPEILSFSATADAEHVLRVDVSVTARRADSAALELTPAGGSPTAPVRSAAVPIAAGGAVVRALGLLPDTRYGVRVVAYGAGGTTVSESREIVTGSLPADLPAFVAGGSDPSPGFVVFAAGDFGLIIDNTGRVVWYHRFPTGAGLNFAPQPNGHYVAMPVTTSGIANWVEIDASGEPTRALGCVSGLRARLHDLIANPDGDYWILCDETRAMDLTAHGGDAAAQVTGTVVQHIASTGQLLFQWSPFDHFEITDADPAALTGAAVNWTHGNSIDLDASGNLIVSFRNLNEVTGIDTRTGAVLWRFGGRRNQFALNGGMSSFQQQHSARTLGGDRILLLDNLGDPVESRAELWSMDRTSRTALLVHSHGSIPPVRTLIGGSVQGLPNGRALVSFGTVGRVEEYDATGNVVWRIESGAGYVFRATRIRSLYHPEEGLTR